MISKSGLNEQVIQEQSLGSQKSYLIKLSGVPIARTFYRPIAVVASRSLEVQEFRAICLKAITNQVLSTTESTTLLCWLDHFELRPLSVLRAAIARVAKLATRMAEQISDAEGV